MRCEWLWTVVVVLSIFFVKGVVFCLDPIPKFFLGDSACYIATALLDDWIPEDRSFTYGYLIRRVSPFSPDSPFDATISSLTPLLVLQSAMSALSALLLVAALRRFFGVRRTVALAAGILCAIEPIQLMYERYVMTETPSLFLFALYMVLAFHYLRGPSLAVLVLIHAAGIAVVSLRLSFLPVVLANAGLLPLLAVPSLLRQRAAKQDSRNHLRRSPGTRRGASLFLGLHLFVSIGATWAIHTGYRQLYSTLSGYPPSYNASTGFFILAIWAPVIEPEDFPYPQRREAVFGNLLFDLKDPGTRNDQFFSDGGLACRIKEVLPCDEANRAAGVTAINALKRDPAAVLALSLKTLGDYFNVEVLREKILHDLAMDEEQRREYVQFRKGYRDFIPLPAHGEEQSLTLTAKFYQTALPWYWFLLCAPLLCAVALIRTEGFQCILMVELFVVTAACVVTAALFAVFPVVRYLHPLGWLAFFPVAVLAGGAIASSDFETRRNG